MPIVQRLKHELAKILKSDEVRENFAKQGALAEPRHGRARLRRISSAMNSARWGDVVRTNNIKME